MKMRVLIKDDKRSAILLDLGGLGMFCDPYKQVSGKPL